MLLCYIFIIYIVIINYIYNIYLYKLLICIFSGQYYRKDDTSYRNRPSSRTDSDYRRYSSSPILDYTAYIELLDPSESMKFFVLLYV